MAAKPSVMLLKALVLLSWALCATARPLGMDSHQLQMQMMRQSTSLQSPASYVDQPRDHFKGNSGTWKQAYYANDTFWTRGSDAPVFLCVGGEGPALDSSAVSNSVHCNIAVEWLPRTKALMLALEHRYYGCHNVSACPYDDSMSDPLKFLSSRQALADIANFHSHATKEFGLSKSNKWISFGGSYPGMLAGWSRVKYPELIHAAVASSAPVHAQLDMVGYNDVTAAAYTLPSVGGSKECSATIKDGHARIGKMFNSSQGRKQLASLFPKKVFNPNSLETLSGQQAFSGFGVASFPAQSNDPTCPGSACNIEKICQIMTDEDLGDNLSRLAALVDKQDALEEPDVIRPLGGLSWIDYWNYQTCNEFGFYQTCEVGSSCFYTQGLLDVDYFIKDAECARWGITQQMIEQNIKATNEYYGGLHPNATRIMWPNGDVDPWHALSILQSPESQMPTLMVSGASHHAWTHPSAPTDQPSVVKARQAIRTQVAAWLEQID